VERGGDGRAPQVEQGDEVVDDPGDEGVVVELEDGLLAVAAHGGPHDLGAVAPVGAEVVPLLRRPRAGGDDAALGAGDDDAAAVEGPGQVGGAHGDADEGDRHVVDPAEEGPGVG
jgi:hypothetical protein